MKRIFCLLLSIAVMAMWCSSGFATQETIGPAVVELESMHDRAWGARVLVSLDGGIHTLLGDEANGWVVDLAHCRDLLPVAESALTAA